MTTSFKSAAREFRSDKSWNKSPSAAICDMAHAIKRGRNPSSPMQGINARVWWRDNAFDYECGLTDYMGEKCDVVTYLYELANDHCDTPAYLALREAIDICWKHFRRVGWPKVKLTEEQKDRRRNEYLEEKRWGRHTHDIFEGYGDYEDSPFYDHADDCAYDMGIFAD